MMQMINNNRPYTCENPVSDVATGRCLAINLNFLFPYYNY